MGARGGEGGGRSEPGLAGQGGPRACREGVPGGPSQPRPFLAARTLDHNEKATEKFVEKAVEQGLSVSDVQLLTKDCECWAGGPGGTLPRDHLPTSPPPLLHSDLCEPAVLGGESPSPPRGWGWVPRPPRHS